MRSLPWQARPCVASLPLHRCCNLHALAWPFDTQVLYSTFVSLLDQGKVRAARLESGSSRLYFEMAPQPEAEAAEAATAATAAANTPAAAGKAAKAAAKQSAVPAEATAVAVAGAGAGPTAAATAAPTVMAAAAAAKHGAMQRQFYIKLAEKNDHLLVHHIVSAGVEFAVVKATLQVRGRQRSRGGGADEGCRGECWE